MGTQPIQLLHKQWVFPTPDFLRLGIFYDPLMIQSSKSRENFILTTFEATDHGLARIELPQGYFQETHLIHQFGA